MKKSITTLLAVTLSLGLVATTADAREHPGKKKAHGGSYTRQVETTKNGDGTWSKEVNGTTPNGKTYSNSVEGERTADGYKRTATRTGPNGGTSVKTTVGTRTENGWSKSVTVDNTPPQNDPAPAK